MKSIKFTLLIFISIAFIGCGEDANQSTSIWGTTTVKYADYYEIANGNIIHTKLNEESTNVGMFLRGYNTSEGTITKYEEFIVDYNMVNEPLDINETFYAWKTSLLNTFTNKSMVHLLKENFGIREIVANYCIVNANVENCQTYIYYRE